MSRTPLGLDIVNTLEGSDTAKKRLRGILETVGGKPIREACAPLEIMEARFHEMRREALQSALKSLEKRTAGRKKQVDSPEAQRIAELEARVKELDRQLVIAETRAVIGVTSFATDLLASERAKKGGLLGTAIRL